MELYLEESATTTVRCGANGPELLRMLVSGLPLCGIRDVLRPESRSCVHATLSAS